MKYETRPQRPVHYFGASRILPAIEKNVLRGHFRINRSQHNSVILNDNFRGIFSRILNRNYSDATVTRSEKYSLRSCEYGSTYTSFNMGAGEDTLMEMLYRLQEAPNGSLIVIEEIELGLHPEAQIKFAEELLKIAWDKKFQIIASSHSSEFIDHVPRISRILIQRTGNGTTHNIVKAPTTRYAMGFLQGDTQYELIIYSEDSFAERILKKTMSADLRRRVRVIGVGGKEQVAKQCGAHVKACWPGKYLGVFDGEVSQADIGGLIRKEFPSIGNIDSINYYSLPGGLPPEKWVLREILDDSGRLEDLKSELEENNIETVREYLQRLNVLLNHHDIGYEFSKIMGLDQKEAEDILIKITCKNNSKLSSFIDKVRMILDTPSQVS